jgi:multiple sugar transport system ATP-binding protein
LTAVFRERHDLAPSSRVDLVPEAGRAHLFDAASGRVLRAA